MKKWDVVIIGSGISSLTCAVLLSKKGKSVCVLEGYSKVGGYLHTFKRFGHRFDTGAHYIGAVDPGQPFHTLLSYLGVYNSELFTPLNHDGFDVLNFPNFKIELPKGYEKTISRLTERFPSEADAIRSFYNLIREVANNFPTYRFNENADMSGVIHLLETPLSKIVEGLTQNPELRAVFYSYCALHGVRHTDVPFALHALLTDSLILSPYGLAQGGDTMAAAYVDRIRGYGGEVHLNAKVVLIETENKLAKAVVTENGDRFEAEWIISGIHPKNTFALVDDPNAFSPAFRKRLGNIQETDGVFGIYAVCENDEIDRLKNYFYFSSIEPNKMFEHVGPHSQPNGVFISSAERLKNPDKSTFGLNILAIGPYKWFSEWKDSEYPRQPSKFGDYISVKESYAEQILNFVDGLQPGFKSKIKKYVTSSPLSNVHFNGSVEGSPYGIYHSLENTGARALGPRTHVPNLLLTGQSCLFPGLLGASVSALRTAGHIVGIKPMLKELRLSGEL